jgi:hypothetical protein
MAFCHEAGPIRQAQDRPYLPARNAIQKLRKANSAVLTLFNASPYASDGSKIHLAWTRLVRQLTNQRDHDSIGEFKSFIVHKGSC